jgi:phospholipid-binding lipoprotein MlaA
MRRLSWLVVFCAGFLALGACSKMPEDQSKHSTAVDEDPLEPFNRAMYQFNYGFDSVVLRPVTFVYRSAVPEKGREMGSNFIENLYTPVTFANSVMQGDVTNSFSSLFRFLINTSWGIGGLFDIASEAGLKARTTDFGQTMAIYGVDSGPYLVLPVIGPSNARDAVGRVADAFINPFNYLDQGPGLSLAIWSATAVDARSRNWKLVNDVYDTSLDPYTTFRSGFVQKRASDIRRAKSERGKSLEKAGF